MVEEVVGSMLVSRRVARGGDAVARGTQGPDISAYRRNRCRANHFIARADRRRAELGLSLLLGERCDADSAGFAECGISGRGAGVEGMASGSGCRQPFGTQHTVWPSWPTQTHGTGAAVAGGIRKISASPYR